jgi:hypothetical protein
VDEESTNPSINIGSTSQRPQEQSITPEAPVITSPKRASNAPKNVEESQSETGAIIAYMQNYQNYGELKELKEKVKTLEARIESLNKGAIQEWDVWKIVFKGAVATAGAIVALIGLVFTIIQTLS